MRRLLVVIAALLLVSAPARAQKAVSDADKKTAVKRLADGDKALARGDKLMKKGDLEQALEAYEEGLAAYQGAYQAFPSPKIYFPIGQAEQKLGRFVDALKHYELVLAEGDAVPDALRAQIKQAMAEVKKNLGALDLTVEPDGAAVLIDGDKVGTTPLGGPRHVEPGKHTVAVTADGYTPFEEAVELTAGKTVKKKVVLSRVPVAAQEPDEPERDHVVAAGPAAPSRTSLYLLVGATSTLAVAGTITGVLALGRHGTYADPAEGGGERESARSSGKTLAVTTDVLMLSAIAIGAYTTYYYLKVYKPRREAYDDEVAAGPALWLSPWATAEGGGLAVGGGF
jgi:tetratricopeptide (TPR) repeat protein